MAEKQTNKDRMREIVDSIENGIKELFESDKYQQYLSTMSRFHRYSVNNTNFIRCFDSNTQAVAVHTHNFYDRTEDIAAGNNTAKLILLINNRQSVNFIFIQLVGNIFDSIICLNTDNATFHNVFNLQTSQQIISLITGKGAAVTGRSFADIITGNNAAYALHIIYNRQTDQSFAAHNLARFQNRLILTRSNNRCSHNIFY